MKVSWKTYPSNIGHRNSPGCFRCHDGKHVTPDGKVIISECKACHTEPQRGPQSGMGEAMAAAEKDWHPWQMPEKHLDDREAQEGPVPRVPHRGPPAEDRVQRVP